LNVSAEYKWASSFIGNELEPEGLTIEVWQQILKSTERMSTTEVDEIEESILEWLLYCWDGEAHIDEETEEEYYIHNIDKTDIAILKLISEHYQWGETNLSKPKNFYADWQFDVFLKGAAISFAED